MVGVNRFVKVDEEIDIPILEIGAEAGDGQRQKMAEIKENRNESLVQESLLQIKDACKSGENLMPPIIKAAKAYVTMGEIVKALKTEFGEWQESAIF